MVNLRRLAGSYLHNCIAHRFLFLADILDELGYERASKKLDDFHDWTAEVYEPAPKVWERTFPDSAGPVARRIYDLCKVDPHIKGASRGGVPGQGTSVRIEYKPGFYQPSNQELRDLIHGL